MNAQNHTEYLIISTPDRETVFTASIVFGDTLSIDRSNLYLW
jgi:hypothetical protein